QVFQVPPAERAAGGRQQEAPHARRGSVRGIRPPALRQALENRVVFAVDGKQFGAVVADGLHEKRAGGDQGLFVGQQHALAAARGGQGGGQPRRADDGGHDRIALRIGRGL